MDKAEMVLKLSNKIKLEEQNGIDASKDTAKMFELYEELMESHIDRMQDREIIPSDADIQIEQELTENGPVPDIPIAACRHIFPIFRRHAEKMKQDFKEYCVSGQSDPLLSEICLFSRISSDFSNCLMKFADWAEEYRFKEFPIESLSLISNMPGISFSEIIKTNLTRIDNVLRCCEQALDEADRSKCMTLCSVISQIRLDIDNATETQFGINPSVRRTKKKGC